MTDPIRVLIVDDHVLVRTGLKLFLMAFDDLELVGEAGTGEQAVALCGELHPDVVLMDLMMPGMDGATATTQIRASCPGVQVIVLTNFQEVGRVQHALQAGAIGYLLKNVSADELAGAIRAARIGRPTLAPEATQALVEVAVHPAASRELTVREREVLHWMVKGLSNPEIAAKLTISSVTVKFHVSNILSKLGVSSRTEAVALAIQQNLVP